MKMYVFRAGEQVPESQRTVRPGKAEWSDCVTVEVDAYKALSLIAELARAVQYKDEKIELTFVGKLTEVEG